MIEQTGNWPYQVVHSKIVSLAKLHNALTPQQTRPIQIFSVVYRTWSSLRARQVQAALSPYFREAVAGVPGKGTDMVTYQIQAMIDVAHAHQVPLSGQVMDITKAFDALPRPQLLQLCDRLGVPAPILRGWHGAMTLNQRRFFLDGAITPPQATERGVPQGCALSCLAMGAVNFALCHLLNRTVPATLPALYADNWEVASPDEHVTHQATQQVDCFTRITDVQLDQAKSHAWATTAGARKRLAMWGHRVAHSAPDLGHRISYTRRRSQKGLLARTPGPELWQYLRASLAAFGRKIQALRQVIWPHASCGRNGGPGSPTPPQLSCPSGPRPGVWPPGPELLGCSQPPGPGQQRPRLPCADQGCDCVSPQHDKAGH